MNLHAFLHEFPGWQYRFTRFLGDQDAPPVAEEVEVLFELVSPVVEPLTADLEVRCCDKELLLPEPSASLSQQAQHLRVTEVPPWVALRTPLPALQHACVQQLDGRTLRKHVQGLLDQPCPDPEAHSVCLTELHCQATQARLLTLEDDRLDLFEEGSLLKVKWEQGILEVPLQRHAESVWVSGPVPPLRTEPPIRLVFSQEAGMAYFDVFVHWSPWTRSDSSAGRVLRKTLLQVEAQGWEMVSEPISDHST